MVRKLHGSSGHEAGSSGPHEADSQVSRRPHALQKHLPLFHAANTFLDEACDKRLPYFKRTDVIRQEMRCLPDGPQLSRLIGESLAEEPCKSIAKDSLDGSNAVSAASTHNAHFMCSVWHLCCTNQSCITLFKLHFDACQFITKRLTCSCRYHDRIIRPESKPLIADGMMANPMAPLLAAGWFQSEINCQALARSALTLLRAICTNQHRVPACLKLVLIFRPGQVESMDEGSNKLGCTTAYWCSLVLSMPVSLMFIISKTAAG